ncbi:hypothetical protein N7457_009609 [Penicillium paradoxum]|uniref:uncharacterized protein n=1 Tax=Penicillium paradoxum TaxID=176176 RepID=UPI002546D573|nr:uncharacterized protein N7457_009609 [Penicillium paradoxum]KAJ5774713.1 hypothetical protein N7457_009609 [Penicillium paradoxum]
MSLEGGIRIIEVCQMKQALFLIHAMAAVLDLWGATQGGVVVGAQDMSPDTGYGSFRVMSSAPCSLRDLEVALVVMLRASVAPTNPAAHEPHIN